MYLKEKALKSLKVKNVILTVLAVGMLVLGIYNMASLYNSYHDDLDTVWHANSTPTAVVGMIISVLVLAETGLSRRMIHEATFFSSYFEGSLDGYISFKELSSVTGRPLWLIKKEINIYRRLYMKDFTVKLDKDGEQIELFSKRTLCECKNCGAPIDKRVYFTGACSYCGSSDLHAKVLAGNRFYSISHEMNNGTNKASYYKNKNNSAKRVVFVLLMALSLIVAFILTFYVIDMAGKYNNQEYLKEVLLDPESYLSSYELIKRDIADNILFGSIIGACLYILAFRRIRRVILINATESFASFFARAKTPFVPSEKIPADSRRKGLRRVRNSIRMGYLEHCTLEMHEDKLKVALAKKIVKDTCPSCAAPITGAVDEDYVCKFCGNRIMGVIEKGKS